MNKFIGISSIILLTISLFSCKNEQVRDQEKISALDTVVFNSTSLDKAKTEELVSSCLDYVAKYDDETRNPEYLFTAAVCQKSLLQYEESVKNFDKVIDQYTDYDKRPECLMLAAEIYDKKLGIISKARHYYNTILSEYPDDDFHDDAAIMVKYLGMSDEQMFEAIIGKKDSVYTNAKDSINN